MRRFIIAALCLLCLAGQLKGDMNPYVAGSVPVVSGCADTPTIIAEQTSVSPDSYISLASYTVGNSITVSDSDCFESITIKLNAGTAGTITCRIGTTNDLTTTYTEQITASYGGSAGELEVFSSANPVLSVGTMYFACQSSSEVSIERQLSPNNDYAGGGYCFASGTSWNLDCTTYATARDTTFEIRALQ